VQISGFNNNTILVFITDNSNNPMMSLVGGALQLGLELDGGKPANFMEM